MTTIHRVVTTCTRDCPNTCGLVATVENGRLAKLAGNPDHPFTRGLACAKTTGRYIARVHHPERVTRPLLRGPDGGWRQVEWDTALDFVAQNLTRVIAQSGPEAVLYYQGYGERTALKLLNRYFFNLLGGVTTLRGSLCGGTGQASQNLDLGERISHDPLDHFNSRAMVLWARNPVSTNIGLAPIARDVARRGGRVVVIDPAPTRSASLATRRIAPRPGADAFLALAAAKLILEAGAEDRGFLANHAEGVDGYLTILGRYGADELCALAGVSRDDAAHLAETLTAHRPCSILLGWGLHRYRHAHHAIRAIDALSAVSGNMGVSGGGVSQGFEEYGPYDPRWWGDGLNPPRRTLLLPALGEEILNARDPAIRMIVVTAANPACMAPNSARVAQAFRAAECVVCTGHFLDDTADLAHVFLPATTFLEEEDVMATYGHNYVGPVNPAIAPVGECRSEFRMFHDLAGRFPFASRFQRTEREWLHDICAPIRAQGCTMEALRQGPFRLNAPMAPYTDKVFPTPSGRFRFMTEFDSSGLPTADPAYPYRLLTIAPHGHICSERTMAEHEPLPAVRCNAAEAARLGLADGQAVLVQSPLGQAPARLQTRPDVRPDTLVAERGGWAKAGHGLNALVRDMTSAVGNGTPYYETAVALQPLANAPEHGRFAGWRILVIQHSRTSTGGAFAAHLERLGCSLDVVRIHEGQPLPEDLAGYAGLLALGGPQHAWDDAGWPHFRPLMGLMQGFDARGLPVAGICLGAQLLARAHGARVRPMGDVEFGYAELEATAAAAADPVMGPALPLPPLAQFHEDTFDLPPGATLLAKGRQCVNQCFRVGRCSYGFQFHLEADAVTVDAWMRQLRNAAPTPPRADRSQDPVFQEELRAKLPLLASRSEDFCRKAARNWLAQKR